jgi:hypothetical protein
MLVKGGKDQLGHRLDRTAGVDDDEAAEVPVVAQQRPRAGSEHRQPAADDLTAVVAPTAG